MSYFRGQYYHSIDAKGRVIFPAKLREIFEEKYDNQLIVTGWKGYLGVFPYEEWRNLEEKLSQKSIIQDKVRGFQRLFMSGGIDLTFDAQGRILIPPSLRKYAGLEKDIVTAGMLRTVEIWDKDRFEENLITSARDLEHNSDDLMAELGI